MSKNISASDLITPADIRRAAQMVREDELISVQLKLDSEAREARRAAYAARLAQVDIDFKPKPLVPSKGYATLQKDYLF